MGVYEVGFLVEHVLIPWEGRCDPFDISRNEIMNSFGLLIPFCLI
jgi:hypothetical protein